MDLVWLIHGKMRPEKRAALLRRARVLHEAQLGQAEARVVELRTGLAIIDDALAPASTNKVC